MKFRAAALPAIAWIVPVAMLQAQHDHPPPKITPYPAVASITVPGPAVLVNTSRAPHTVEVTLTAEPTRLSLVPGKSTVSFAYNGRVPGPMLDVYEGDSVIVHFVNRLAEPTTIHWHGLHIPNAADGSPYYSVMPGKSFDYVFRPQKGSAGTYWYHPHPDAFTGRQIAGGLFGSVIIRAHDDPLPKGITEKLIVISDNRFKPDGSIDFADPSTEQGNIDLSNGREGDIIYVNGAVMPTITIRSGETQLWRVINASAARIYRLAIPGHTLVQVGTDGGLFEKPVDMKEILIANSERAMFLVRGTGAPGTSTTLQTLPYDRYVPQTRPANWNTSRDLLTLKYSSAAAVKPIAIPAVLRPVPAIDTAFAVRTRVFVLQQGFINGRPHDMNRIDETGKLGDVEIWQIENVVGMDHNFHLHGFQFQVIDRDGVAEPYRSWKDTINLPKHSTGRFIVRLDDFAGKWMYHCHILDHEDHGMMGVLEVK